MLGEVLSVVETSLVVDVGTIRYRLSEKISGDLARYPKGCGIFGALQKKRQWQRLIAKKAWLGQLIGSGKFLAASSARLLGA